MQIDIGGIAALVTKQDHRRFGEMASLLYDDGATSIVQYAEGITEEYASIFSSKCPLSYYARKNSTTNGLPNYETMRNDWVKMQEEKSEMELRQEFNAVYNSLIDDFKPLSNPNINQIRVYGKKAFSAATKNVIVS